MDPDANLAEQTDLANLILNGDGDKVASFTDVYRLAELVLAMNEWLSSGGFKPKA
jgi:hypothetical protein